MKKVGWIGTGVMGQSMCGHILSQGYEVSVFNRSRAKAEPLVANGATWCSSPREAAEDSDCVFTIVGYPADVEDVILGPNGVLAGAREGSVLVDMTTSEPSLAVRIYEASKAKSIDALDAPVSGGDVGAREARLAIMVGGERQVFDRVLPLFEHMGKNIAYMGSAGAGQHTKVCNQIHIATTMIGVVESLLYAHKAGLDMLEMIEVIGKGAAGSWSINNYGPRIARGNFDPGFFIKHFVKDMDIALKEARRMKLSLPGLALAHQFYVSAMAIGLENMGTHSLYQLFEKMNGV
ncbi:MAG: NAD(P)-dependent oxidoreductase [Desulfobacteraceae bacterium]|nr:NAD(P)-dependent oxidoreductase [Desulfobacteraceae bacterium]